MGFFTERKPTIPWWARAKVAIPFRVGWGFSHAQHGPGDQYSERYVAIPFRVGWGFSQASDPRALELARTGRNPFQGGMGFFTPKKPTIPWWAKVKSQSLSGWDGVFHSLVTYLITNFFSIVAIPFRVGWGFSPETTSVC